MKKEVWKVKIAFDLNDYEGKVFTFLLNNGITKVSKLSRGTGVPRSRVYDVAETLNKKGFIEMIENKSKPLRLRPKSISKIIKITKKRYNKERDNSIKLMGSFK